MDLINAYLPEFSFKPKKQKLRLCKLCTFEIKTGEQVRQTTCTHLFHSACIDQFLMLRASRRCCFECGRNVFGGKIKISDLDLSDTDIGRSYSARV